MMPSRPAAISIAAGPQQLPVLHAARALGLAVIGVDRDPDAPGFAACDARVVASTHSPEETLAGLREVVDGFDLRGVLVRSAGPPVVTAAEVAAAFGLPGVPPRSARTIVDKEALGRACRKHGLPAPALRSGESLDELDPDTIDLPCVVKPALSLVGKGGIRVVSRREELSIAFTAACEASITGRANVEAWIPGRDVGLVSVVRGGHLHPITLIDEWNDVAPSGAIRPRGVAAPSRFSGGPEEARVVSLARRLVEAFELDTTAFMMACRLQPGGEPVLTEIHLDLGGDRILDTLLPASAPFDVLAHAVARLLGEEPKPAAGAFRPAAVVFEPPEPGATARPWRLLRAESVPALESALEGA